MAPSSPLLEAHKLTVGVAGKVFCRDLDFALAAGERLAILGRNGAGKSTLLSVLAGLRAPLSGEVRVSGTTYAELGTRKSALIRGWLPQARGDAFASTVLETVLVGRHPHLERWGWESAQDAQIVRRALVAVDLAGLEQRDVQTLSGGERMRTHLARLAAGEHRVLLVDEPTASLDPDTADWIRSHLEAYRARRGATILLASHNMAEVERLCSHVVMLKGGRAVDTGSPADLLQRYGRDDLEEVFLDIARGRNREDAL